MLGRQNSGMQKSGRIMSGRRKSERQQLGIRKSGRIMNEGGLFLVSRGGKRGF